MLKIRLQKVGKKNSPSFRVVLVEHTFRPQGKFIELLGSYNKVQKQKSFNKDRILYWISKGAQVSPTMHNLLIDEKILEGAKMKAWKPKKKPAASLEGKQAGPPQSEGLGGETPVETPKEEPKAEEPKEEPKKEEAPIDTETKTAPTPEEVGVPTDNVGK